ncbi:amino acid permease [Saccharibacter sp. 17.LH.SD]|uniref:APC family permease n=1 Tax=Saccharibacter sp. 17.LH.SD TaxID=2689393 RepID=UPI00136BB236|nr:amino acid permease [Saccharibacter sp. 17.LH.SD]MXV44563.1 amino acid permease [Saccharibacter sp. 17.LH.SD]
MTNTPSPPSSARRKTLKQLSEEQKGHGLKRSLTATQLLVMGVGTTVGAGVYVMTGTAAAEYAGPAILLSFLLSALACLFTALCYGELASTFPVSGSAYSYAYLSMGEKAAWAVGWLLLLEYCVAGTAVASGLSGYLTSLLEIIHIHVPAFLSQTTLQSRVTPSGGTLALHPSFNLVGFILVILVSLLLIRGTEESSRFNTLIVFLKIGVLALFIIMGVGAINPHNWHPFIPPSQGNFHYGLSGVFRAASIVFFAYGGFEIVSTASAEARNPTRDVPIGIIGSLAICTVIYIAVAAVLLGIVPYQQLDVADPLAVATKVMHKPWLAVFINTGATIGLFSVLFGLIYAASRILLTIGHDQLIPSFFCRIHDRFKTPLLGTLVLGLIMGTMTATLPIALVGDLLCIGVTLAFAMVCFTVIWQRNRDPETERPFRVPFGGVTIHGFWIGIIPGLGILFCFFMLLPLFWNMIHALMSGNPLPFILLVIYVGLGVGTYYGYGKKHSIMAPRNNPPS